jgi:hypothetical protein
MKCQSAPSSLLEQSRRANGPAASMMLFVALIDVSARVISSSNGTLMKHVYSYFISITIVPFTFSNSVQDAQS